MIIMEIDSYVIFGTYIPNKIAMEISKITSEKDNSKIESLEETNNILLKKFGVEILEINYPIGVTDSNFHIEKRYFLNIPIMLNESNVLSYQKLKDEETKSKIQKFHEFCTTLGIKNEGVKIISVPYIRGVIHKEKLGIE
jgi:hypothetical protein